MNSSQKLTTSYIMRRLHESDLYYFSTPAFATLLDVPTAKAYEILRRLKSEGVIRPVEAGKYLLLGYQPERVLANPHFIATHLAHPAYISFWSALHFHGLTEQVPRTVFVATTRRHRRFNFDDTAFVFVHMAPPKFFGYQREMIADLPVLVAEVEKALVDSLDQLRYAGGVVEVAKALYAARERVDVERLVEYANRIGNRSLCSRLGYLLERFGRPSQGLEISQSFVLLDPSAEFTLRQVEGLGAGTAQGKTQGQYDPRWRVRVNVSEEELWAWRET